MISWAFCEHFANPVSKGLRCSRCFASGGDEAEGVLNRTVVRGLPVACDQDECACAGGAGWLESGPRKEVVVLAQTNGKYFGTPASHMIRRSVFWAHFFLCHATFERVSSATPRATAPSIRVVEIWQRKTKAIAISCTIPFQSPTYPAATQHLSYGRG